MASKKNVNKIVNIDEDKIKRFVWKRGDLVVTKHALKHITQLMRKSH